MERFKIPLENPKQAVEDKLNKLERACVAEKNALIVAYVGHGCLTPNKEYRKGSGTRVVRGKEVIELLIAQS